MTSTAAVISDCAEHRLRYLSLLTLGALGVVYGDIGTSPLYAMRECFTGEHGMALTIPNVYGILSLVTWSLIVVISIKYVIFVMRADNRGEGGVLALMALAQRVVRRHRFAHPFVVLTGLFGAALLYGDGVITPAISVLSAIEGIAVAAPEVDHFILPLAISILCLLFSVQKGGTGKIGIVFGPVILLWFVVIAGLGLNSIVKAPEILGALSPWHALAFFQRHSWHGLVALGAVFLVVTGGEALYADMGHFGRRPIRYGWFLVVLPALLLNYFGQGALLLLHPEAIVNPFYKLAPDWALFPLIGLATAAAVIASQALISGAFSLTRQAVQLGYLPRTSILHTSDAEIGQIYSPFVNWALLIATTSLVLFFRTSSNLAAAYGVAVTLTMAITTSLMFFITRYIWKWPFVAAFSATVVFLLIDLAFLSANLLKIWDGGWLPLAMGIALLTVMTTWWRGRMVLAERLKERSISTKTFLASLGEQQFTRVEGAAIFMTGNLDLVPPSLIHNITHNKVLHSRVLFVTVHNDETPYVYPENRSAFVPLSEGFYKVVVNFGFMETPDVYRVLRTIFPELGIDENDVTYFLGRETILATARPGMAIWRERLFAFLSRNAQRATVYYNLPSDAVIEIGMQIEL